jgi:Rho termination factor, N-terminal domain
MSPRCCCPQVAELKELARENNLKGYSTLKKNELVDFLAESLPEDYQI